MQLWDCIYILFGQAFQNPMDLKNLLCSILITGIGMAHICPAATVEVGQGSYTTTFPGTDIAGRNGLPSGIPQLSGPAEGRPVPTNDWWSALLNQNHASNLFNYPMTMRTLPNGLDVGLIVPVSTPNGSSQPISDISPIIVGVTGLSAKRATVYDYSDWTVTMDWDSEDHSLRATTGIAMPFLYFTKAEADTASVTVNLGTATISGANILISGSQGGANFVVYGPQGSSWSQTGSTYTSTLAGKNYWSMAFLPDEANIESEAAAWQEYAHVHPTHTEVSWNYDEPTATLRTDFITTVEIFEGAGTTVMQGLLPHQWAHITSDPALSGFSISSIRGELKLLAANTFSTERTFQGILPTLPSLGLKSPDFDPAILHGKITQIARDSLPTWTDSYNEGQLMNRLIQTARIANETGDIAARDSIIETVKQRLEDWLTFENGEVAFLFHYSSTWSALLGYPAGHGQDTNLNDHHFHWGYFIHAAAFIEQFQPGWAEEWGPMVNLLVRDAASPQRDDALFPFLRNFSPFAGHSWANGFATFPFGNDQESSSESMQFHSSLIHWGSITGDDSIRDLGIYLYTTELSAIEEYWLDINKRTFKPGYGYSVASRIWGNGYDNQTFFTGDIAAAYGIELYPIHGGSLYLGEHLDYAEQLWAEMASNTGILSQAVNPHLWHDLYWQFLAFTDPAKAIELYNGNPSRDLKFGISDAQTYYWLHAMNALGRVDASVTADDPLAAVFDLGGVKTYVAHNYSLLEKTVQFSNGESLLVPPGEMATSQDLPFWGFISTPFQIAPVGGTIPLTVTLEGDISGLSGIEFLDNSTVIGTLSAPPYELRTEALSAGRHTLYARLETPEGSELTDFTSITVGSQVPFAGSPITLPGTFEAGSYDRFEGGNGQGIAYHDSSPGNNGDYRPFEDVDTTDVFNEGAVLGWISDGEWLEYTVDVSEAGIYDLNLRYASGNNAGGGPFYFEVNDQRISANLSVGSTGDWDTYSTATFENIELPAGVTVLRLNVVGGELNLGRLSFSRSGNLNFIPPIAEAGEDMVVSPPLATTVLDGSSSSVHPENTINFLWEQLFGPVVATISDIHAEAPQISNLEVDGLYRFRLTVDDGERSDWDEVEVIVGNLSARPPSVAIFNPSNGTQLIAGQTFTISATATDTDGTIERVDLFNSSLHLGTQTEEPYDFLWSPPPGEHALTVRALDSDGLWAKSAVVDVIANAPAPCTALSANGDFEYTFSAEAENPTITFTPNVSGVGNNLLIFYYGVGSGPYPGYTISPDTPFQLNASKGQTINFYFTYSHPQGGERNSLDDGANYTIGTCGEAIETDPEIILPQWRELEFSETDLGNPALEDTVWGVFADPDRDSIPNLIEFMLLTNPNVFNHTPVSWRYDEWNHIWKVRYSLRSGMPTHYSRLQWSQDLINWSSNGVTVDVISQKDGIELLEATIDNQNLKAGNFIRFHSMP